MGYTSKCRDCVLGRKEYGAGACPVHYDPKEDNARSVRQTGKPIKGFTKSGKKLGTSNGYMPKRDQTPNDENVD